MPRKQKSSRRKARRSPANGAAKENVQSVLATLKRLSKPRIREEMSSRYGIVTNNAFGVRMSDMQQVAKRLGRDHALALALWETGNYEARTVAAFVAEPERVTPALMDRWCRDFDNWAICDTVCFKLFDRTLHAFGKVTQWADWNDEFQKRAAFALLASLALHDKRADNKAFAQCLPLIDAAATDGRNFVKKGVSWALRAIGGRNAELESAAVVLARRLSSAADSTARWVGKDALRALA
jgi:3-methyladenine DNA glycosylase AlkD